MGGNLACAALEHGHDVVGFDRDERLTTVLAREGLEAAASLQELVAKLTAPRTVLVSGGARRPR
jgi:6-phosphogluconate dehydrogenase